MSVTTHAAKKEAARAASLASFLLGALCAAACHADPPPEAPSAAPATSALEDAGASAASGYRCTAVLGLAVTSEWYRAGFENLVEDERWQAITKPHTFVENWADPDHAVWKELPQSPCAERWTDPDRVLFFAANYKYTSEAEWDRALDAVVRTLRTKYPGVRRIELLSMVRTPGNVSCGSEKGVVSPLIDAAIARASAHSSELVAAGPRFEVKSCDDLEKGGPHFTKAGGATVASLVAEHYKKSDSGVSGPSTPSGR
ncbi:MAG TPA: hypothetical protein VMS65_06190 [Polyangiaceae bacterium]|nr:hypothetical protein [Polyangiaceae bacterium]